MAIRSCVICERPDVRDINFDLNAGMSLRRVCGKYQRLNLSTLHRHVEHADEYAQREEAAVEDVAKIASLSDLDTDSAPSQEEWESVITAIVCELRGWHSLSVRIADALARAGHQRLAPMFVATIPKTVLRQACTDKPARRSYVPQEWLDDDASTYHHNRP